MTINDNTENKRPLNVPHLVFGLVFAGIATVWFLGQATNADLPRSAVGLPVVLIGAGVIGLVASLAGARRRSPVVAAEHTAARAAYDARAAAPTEATVIAEDTDDTLRLDTTPPTTGTAEEKS